MYLDLQGKWSYDCQIQIGHPANGAVFLAHEFALTRGCKHRTSVSKHECRVRFNAPFYVGIFLVRGYFKMIFFKCKLR